MKKEEVSAAEANESQLILFKKWKVYQNQKRIKKTAELQYRSKRVRTPIALLRLFFQTNILEKCMKSFISPTKG